jgi:DNA repair photolyase
MVEGDTRHKGRGAQSNPRNRFHPHHSCREPQAQAPVAATQCDAVDARTIIATNRSPDIPFNQSINPYQGCEHGCIYCYARPTHAYLDLSPGLDFETRLTYKRNAPQLLERELAAPGYRCQPITLGANTDPYQPVEKRFELTRRMLEILQRCQHPATIITKSALICRDLDILAPMAADGLISVAVSVTTCSAQLKRQLEPRAPTAAVRLETIATLRAHGIPVTVLAAPMIPAINDAELETILERAAAAGAGHAAYILLRLPLEVRELFNDWLQAHYPLRADKVMSLLRQCRGGRDYDNRFGHRMRGTGPFADLLSQRFHLSCKKLGLTMGRAEGGRTDLFVPPGVRQHTLF